MNFQLIQDEGHRNEMDVSELAKRMKSWLSSEYTAVLIEDNGDAVGYALWREEQNYLYIRQFFIDRKKRRKGMATAAIEAMKTAHWEGRILRLEVLVANEVGHSFWRSIGFSDYCLTMECTNASRK